MKLISLFCFLFLNHFLSAQNLEDGWYIVEDKALCEKHSERLIDNYCLSSTPFVSHEFLYDFRISPIDSSTNYLFLIYSDSGTQKIQAFTSKHNSEKIVFVDENKIIGSAIIQNTISIGALSIVIPISKTEKLKGKLQAQLSLNKADN